jgi:LppP/LprE lipoprotein
VKWAVLIAAATVTVAGCGSGDSTVSKTPEPTIAPAPRATAAPSLPPPPAIVAPTTTAAADPCAVNLAAPEIIKAVSELPRDPRSNQAWNPEPLAGNYNECAQLSAVIVKANTNSDNPNTRAVLFHLGRFIPTGVPDTYGFNGIDESATTGDTIALKYSSGVEGLDSAVKLRWNGNGVELIGNTPG